MGQIIVQTTKLGALPKIGLNAWRIGDYWHLNLAGLLCLLGYAFLAWYSIGTWQVPTLTLFFGCLVWVSLPVLIVFLLDRPLSFVFLLFWALAFRLCGLYSEPLFEDDYFRYLWDGYVFIAEGSPYGVLPVDYFGDREIPHAVQRLLDGINYPDVPTIYGPTNQYLFGLAHLVYPGHLLPLQILFIGFDLLIIGVLARVAPLKYVLLYAWCPLVVKEIAFTAHPDVVGICLLLLAVTCAVNRHTVKSGVFLALAIGAKIFAVLLAPFILLRLGWKGWLACFVGLCILYLPFVLQGSSELASLWIFATEWEFNASLYTFVASWTSPLLAKIGLGFFYLLLLATLWFKYKAQREQDIPRGDVVFGIFLLVAPVVNPWYLLWVLPFAVVYPSLWAWVASVSIFLAYVTSLNLGDYSSDPFTQPTTVLVFEYAVILVALMIDVYRRLRQKSEKLVTAMP